MNAKDKAIDAALKFVEFCWRDVALNDYAEEQRAETEALLRQALSETKSCTNCLFNVENKCTWFIQKHNKFIVPPWLPHQMYIGGHMVYQDCPAWEPI